MRREIIPCQTISSVLQPSVQNSFGNSYGICDGQNYTFLSLSDFTGLMDPAIGFAGAQTAITGFISYETNGTQAQVSTAPSTGVSGASVGGSIVRIAQVSDPDNSAKKCWLMRCASSDADTGGTGNKRTEFSTSAINYPGFKNKRILFGINVRLPDWSSTTDTQIVWQIHGSLDNPSVSPWLAHMVTGGVETITLRYSSSTTPTNLNAVVMNLYQNNNIPVNTWRRIVVDTVHSWDGVGYCKIWINDTLVVDYIGPLGFYEPNQPSYPKAGIYHWTDSGNTWDATLPVREVYYKGPFYCGPSVSSTDLRQLLQTL